MFELLLLVSSKTKKSKEAHSQKPGIRSTFVFCCALSMLCFKVVQNAVLPNHGGEGTLLICRCPRHQENTQRDTMKEATFASRTLPFLYGDKRDSGMSSTASRVGPQHF